MFSSRNQYNRARKERTTHAVEDAMPWITGARTDAPPAHLIGDMSPGQFVALSREDRKHRVVSVAWDAFRAEFPNRPARQFDPAVDHLPAQPVVRRESPAPARRREYDRPLPRRAASPVVVHDPAAEARVRATALALRASRGPVDPVPAVDPAPTPADPVPAVAVANVGAVVGCASCGEHLPAPSRTRAAVVYCARHKPKQRYRHKKATTR